MIMPAEIAASLRAALESAFPGETVYEDLTPRDFTRPSNMVELVKITLDPQSFGQRVIGVQYQYKITTFSEVDEVHYSHLPVLDLRAMTIMGIFAPGYIKAGDRAPKVTACTADTSLFDCAEVTLTLALTLDRSDFAPAELLDLMKEVHMRIKLKEETNT